MVKLAKSHPLKFIGLVLGLVILYVCLGTNVLIRTAQGEGAIGAAWAIHVDSPVTVKLNQAFTVKVGLVDQMGKPLTGRTYGTGYGQFYLPGDAIKNVDGQVAEYWADTKNVREVKDKADNGTGVYAIPVIVKAWPAPVTSNIYTLEASYIGQGAGSADQATDPTFCLVDRTTFTADGTDGTAGVIRYSVISPDKLTVKVPVVQPDKPTPEPIQNVINVRVKPVAQVRDPVHHNRMLNGLADAQDLSNWLAPTAVDNTGQKVDVAFGTIKEETMILHGSKTNKSVPTGIYDVQLIVTSPAKLAGKKAAITFGVDATGVEMKMSTTVNFSTVVEETAKYNTLYGIPYLVEMPHTPVIWDDPDMDFYWVGVTPLNAEERFADYDVYPVTDTGEVTNSFYMINEEGNRVRIKCLRLYALVEDPDMYELTPGGEQVSLNVTTAEMFVREKTGDPAQDVPPAGAGGGVGVGANGTGYAMRAVDGAFNSPMEQVKYDMYPSGVDPTSLYASTLAEKQYIFWVHGKNQLGVWGYYGIDATAMPVPKILSVDRTAPTVSIAEPPFENPARQVAGNNLNVSGTVNADNGGTFRSSLNSVEIYDGWDAAWTDAGINLDKYTNTWSTMYDTLFEPGNAYTLQARAIDGAGNMTPAGGYGTRNVIIDNTKPVANISSPGDGMGYPTGTSNITVTGAVYDPDTAPIGDLSFDHYTVEWAPGIKLSGDADTGWTMINSGTSSVGGPSTTGTLANWNVGPSGANLTEGPYSLRVRCWDKAGNHSDENPTGSTNMMYVFIDSSKPFSALTVPYIDGSANNWASTTIRGTGRDFMAVGGAQRYEEDAAGINYFTSSGSAGGWTLATSSDNSYSNNAARYAATANYYAQFTFSGTYVTWVSTKGPNRGSAQVWIDGAFVKTVNLNAPGVTYYYQQEVFSKTFTTGGSHTLKIVVVSGQVDVDALDLYAGSGVNLIDTQIRRVSDGYYWHDSTDGTPSYRNTFQPSSAGAPWLATTVNSGRHTAYVTNWQYGVAAIPSHTQVDITTRATDDTGNVEASPTSTRLMVQTEMPVTTYQPPANGLNNWYVLLPDLTVPPLLLIGTEPSSPNPGVKNMYYQWTTTGVVTAPTSGYIGYSATLPATSISHILDFDSPSHGLTADGTRRLWYYSSDIVGNAETPHYTDFSRDIAAPDAPAFTAPQLPDYQFQRATVSLGGNTRDAASGVGKVEMTVQRNDGLYWQSGTNWNSTPYWFTISGTTGWSYGFNSVAAAGGDGSYTFKARATDVAGNVSGAGSLTCIIDNTAPTTYHTFSIPAPDGDNGWYKTDLSVSVVPRDPSPGSGIALTYGAWNFNNSAVNISGLWGGLNTNPDLNGTYYFGYYSTDNSGNSQTPVFANFKKDSERPFSAIMTPTIDGQYFRRSIAFAGTAWDPTNPGSPGSGLQREEVTIRENFAPFYYWNGVVGAGAAWTATPVWVPTTGSTNWTYSWDTLNTNVPQDNADYKLTARAVDNAGGAQITPVERVVHVDNTAPVVTLVDPPDTEGLVPTDYPIRATFSEKMAPATVNSPAANFAVKNSVGASMPGTVLYSEQGASYYAVFTVTGTFSRGAVLTGVVSRGATDLAGNPVVVNHSATGTSIIGQEPWSAITYSGAGWSTVSDAGASGGAYKHSNVDTNYAEVTFTGTDFRWLSGKGPNYGIAHVWLDDTVDQGTFDLYSASQQYKQTVVNLTGLTDTTHKLKIIVTNAKNAASSDYYVDVDAFTGAIDTTWKFTTAGVDAQIWQPVTGSRVYGRVPIMGQANGEAFQQYKLQYKKNNGTDTFHDFGVVHTSPQVSQVWPFQTDWSDGATGGPSPQEVIDPANPEHPAARYHTASNITANGADASSSLQLSSAGTVWPYRKAITITNTGAQMTDYQIRVPVTFVTSHMKANFDDVRFTDSDGQSILNHWKESFIASSAAVFWTKIPVVPAGTPANPTVKTVYMNYGNFNAQGGSSNGANVFDRFDDFNDASLNGSVWTNLGGASEGSGTLNFNVDAYNYNDWTSGGRSAPAVKLATAPTGDFTARIKISSFSAQAYTQAGISAYSSDASAYLMGLENNGTVTRYQLDKIGGTAIPATYYANNQAVKFLYITRLGASYIFQVSDIDGTNLQQIGTTPYNDIALSNIVLFAREWTSPGTPTPGYPAVNMDDFIVQKYSGTATASTFINNVTVANPGAESIDGPLSTAYAANGSLVSSVFNSGSANDWGLVKWTENVPTGTRITIQVRHNTTAADNNPEDGGWSTWSAPITVSAGEQIPGFNAQYIQYKVNMFANSNATKTPVLNDITFYNGVLETWDTTALPLGDGSYTIRLLVSDQLTDPPDPWKTDAPGKHSIAAEVVVNVENTSKPTSTITAPAIAPPKNTTAVQIKGTTDVTGTGYDEFPGVGKIDVRVKRSSDGLYWSGSGNNWSSDANQWILTTDTEGAAAYRYWKYSLNTTLQDAGNSVFTDGLYTIESKATDKAGAQELLSPDPYPLITVRIDNTPPTGSITFPASNSYVSGGFVSVDGGVNDPPDDANLLDYKLEYRKTGASTWTVIANDSYEHPRLPLGTRYWKQTSGADFNAGSNALANGNGTTLLATTALAQGTTTTALADTLYLGGAWTFDSNSGLYTLVFANRTLPADVDFLTLQGEVRLAVGSWLPYGTTLLVGTTTTSVNDTTNIGGAWSYANGLYTLITANVYAPAGVTLQGKLNMGGRVEMDRYLLTDGFNGSAIDGANWLSVDTGANMSVANAVSVNGPANTQQISNTPALVTVRNFDRSLTQNIEADFTFSSFTANSTGNAGTYFGWKNTTSLYDLGQYVHAFWIFNGQVYVYNNGVSASTGYSLAAGTKYRLRVDLKVGGGATYYFSADRGMTWTTAYDTTSGTATPLKAGFTNHKYGNVAYYANTFMFDTVTIQKYLTGPSTYSSAVYDAGASINWNTTGQIKWSEANVNGTTSDVTLQTRTGSSATAGDQNWTGWSTAYTNPTGGAITSTPNRYIQYRVSETYTGTYAPSSPLPAVGDVTLSYTGGTGANQLEYWNTAGLQEGAYTLRLTVTDKAGNTNTTPIESKPVTIDKTAPHASLNNVGTVFGAKRYIRANVGLTGTADDGMWTNKVPIAITNPTGSAQTDYQVKVPVTFATGMRSDFNDLRFTDGSGNKLPYWIETFTASSAATVWVLLPALPSPGGTTIYMSYGNSAADVTNQSFTKVMRDANDMTNAYRQDLPTTGAVGLWHLETPTTSGLSYLWADSTANANNAVLDNGAWSYTQYGHMQGTAGAYFDGVDDVATVANSASLQALTGNATFEFWIYPQNVSIARSNPIDKSYGGQFAFTLETNGSLTYYHGTAKTSGSYTSFMAVPPGSLENNNWYHVAVVRDNTAKTLKGYLNGVLVSSTTYTILPGAATDNVTFGVGYTGAPFKGLLDEVRISNAALTSDAIMRDVGIRKWAASEPSAGVPGANAANPYEWGNFGHYELSFAGPEGGTIPPASAGGTTPVTAGALGTWNTRAVQDGDNYSVKLYDIDLANNTATTSITGMTVDNTPPRVTSTVPAKNETFVDDRISQKAYFTESVRAATLDSPAVSFTKKLMNPPNTLVAGTVKYTELGAMYYATFTQTTPPLTYDAWYTDTITPAVKDQAGNPLAVAFEENDAIVSYSGTGWTDAASANASGGGYKWTNTTADDVTIGFDTDTAAGTGTAVAWVGTKTPSRGIARVYLDGVDVGTIDQYSATTVWQQPLYKTGDLTNGHHTLRIAATGTKNGASSDTRIDVDAFWLDFNTVWNFQVAGIEVGINSPTPNQRLRGTAAITGTADGSVASFQNWILEYAPHGTSSWTNITTSTTRVVNGLLANWVTPASGQYDVRLTVNDTTSPTPRFKQKTVTVTVDNTNPTVSADRLTYFRDSFDARDATNWSFNNAMTTVPFSLNGENVIRNVGAGGQTWASNYYRPNYTIKDRDQVSFDFKMASGATSFYNFLEGNDNQGEYMRWGIVATSTSTLVAESKDKSGYANSGLALGDMTNKWFHATLSVDDAAAGTFSTFVYEINNPGNSATFTKAMPRGISWRFHSYMDVGAGYLDNYEEVRPVAATVKQGQAFTLAGTATDALTGIDDVQINVDGRAWWEPMGPLTTVDACDALTGWTSSSGSLLLNAADIVSSYATNGTFVMPSGPATVKALVIGGGGGGANTGSGGGAGGYVYQSALALAPGSYPIVVGTGGAGGASTAAPGTKGNNSTFAGLTAEGGGNGVSHGGGNGGNGGSGGGGAISTTTLFAGGTGSQGNAGGGGLLETNWIGNNGGGGGAGGAGIAGGNYAGAGNGGAGISNNISGSAVMYAGGGGGGEVNGSYVGAGFDGGGNANMNAAGSTGVNGRGGGGGGGSYNAGTYTNGGGGGSGVVIVSYADPSGTSQIEGTSALRLQKTSTASTQNAFSKAISATDMSGKRINVWLYVRDATARNKISQLQMYVGGSNWLLQKAIDRTSVAIGWNTISIDMMNPDGVWFNAGTPDLRSVTTIRLDVNTNNASDLYGSGEFIMDRWTLSPSTRIDQSIGTTSTGLVGDWHLDDTPGSTAIDSSGNNNGTASGTGYWTTGRYGASALLGNGDDMVNVPETNTALRLGTQQSMEAWVKFNATAADSVRLVGKGNGNNRNYGLWLMTDGSILNQFQNASATAYNCQTTAKVNDGAWHHVAGTYDGATMKVYIDGVEAASYACGAITPVTSSDPLTIAYGNAGAALNGAVDEVKVYNVALTADQVGSRYVEGPVASGSPYLTYQGNWRNLVNPVGTYMSGGSVKTSNHATDTATVTFTGTSVTWIGMRGPDRGIAQLFVDGVRVTDGDTLLTGDAGTGSNGLPNMSGFDLYSVSGSYRQLLYTKSGLSNAQHTLTITVTGAKNGSATDSYVDVDAIDLGSTYPWTYTFSTAGWAAGAHTLTARAFDRVGNMAATPTSYTINVDDADPVVALTSPADGIWSNASAFDIKGRATDSDFNYYLLEYGFTASPSYWFPVNSNPRYNQVTGTAPNDYLGKFKAPYTVLDPANQYRASWDRADTEGWTAAGFTAQLSNGAIGGTTNSADASLTSPGIALDSNVSKVLHVRMKNANTANDSAQLYWLYSYPYSGSYLTGGVNLQLGEVQQITKNEGGFTASRGISWPLGPAGYAGKWVDYRLDMKTGQVKGTARTEGPTTTTGTWTTETNRDASEGTAVYATSAGSASYTFSNNNFSVFTTKGPDRGKARVYLDNALITDGTSKLATDNPNDINQSGIDLYAPVILGQQQIYSRTAIPDVYTGSSPRTLSSGASLQSQMNLTAGSVLSIGSTLKIGTVAQNAGDVANIGGFWTGTGPWTLIGTREIVNSNVGLQGSLTVVQGAILLSGSAINTNSTTNSLIDTINVGGSWVFSNTHTIKIEYSGEKNALSTGTRIDVDAYEDTSLLQDYPTGWPAVGFWAGTITQMRLDPNSTTGNVFGVDYISREASDGVYKIRLSAFDRAGRTASTQRTINIDTTPPKCILTAPTNMQFLASGTNVSVAGNAGDYNTNGVQSGVNKVEVRVIAGVNGLTANPGPWQLAAGTTSWSKTISIADGWYGVQARATDNAGNVRESNIVYVTVDNTAPPVPRLRAVTSKTAGGILLSWTPVKDEGSGVDYYVVYRNNVPITDKLYYPDMRTIDTVESGLTSKNFGGASAESFRKYYGCNAIDKDGFGFNANANVRYAVRAVDAAGNYSARYSLAVYYDTKPPDAPGSPAASIAGVTNTGLLSWSTSADNQGIAEYRIYRGTSPGFVAPDETKQVGSCDVSDPGSGATTATKFYDPNLAWNQDYYYKVVAFDDMMNYSSPSAEVHVKTPASKTDFNSALPHLAYSSNPTECALCHRAHTAKGEKLINETYEAKLCFTCHDGSGSNSPTKAEFDYSPSGAHRVRDELYPAGKLSCIDCHNPHLNTEASSVDNFDDDLRLATDPTTGKPTSIIPTVPNDWTFTGGNWAMSTGMIGNPAYPDPTHAELRQSDTGASTAFAKKDTGLVGIASKGGYFSVEVKLNSDGRAYLSIAGDGSASSGLTGSITRTGSSAVFSLTDGITTKTANFAYNAATQYRINLKINPERWVQGTVTTVTKADLPDGHDTITDAAVARGDFIASATSFAGSWVGFGTSGASADFDMVKVNNPGMLQTRYREFTQTAGSSYSIPDDRVLTEAFCLSCHGTSNDNPGGSQMQYYTSIHNPEMGGMQGQISDQDLTNYVRNNPTQVTPRWQTIRDEWKDLKTNPAYVLLGTGQTLGASLKNTSNGCFYCHGYHGLQFYYRTQKGEEELCYNCHGRTANKSRDNWNVYQQYNGFVQEKSPFLTYIGTWLTDEGANYGGNAVKYATGGVVVPPWYNASWGARKLITVNNPNIGVDNYQVKLTITNEPSMKADYSDLRFAAADGTTMRTFWIEKYNTASAIVWVNLPRLDAGNSSNNNKLYMYYGNGGAASASNIVGTFLYADDFTATTIDPSWSPSGSVTMDGSPAGWVTLNSVGATTPSTITHSYPVQAGDYVVEAKVKFPSVYRQRPRLLKSDNSDPTGASDYFFGDNQVTVTTYGGGTTVTDYLTTSWNAAWDNSAGSDYTAGQELLTQYKLQASPQQFTWQYYDYAGYNSGSGPIRTHSTVGGATNLYAKIQFQGSESDNSDWQIDWVRVRKSLPTDPTVAYSAPDGTTANSVSFTFTGTEFSWASTKGPDRGVAQVFIDNVSQGDVNLQLPPEQGYLYNVTVFNKQYLSLAPHTVVITAKSGRVDIDAVQGGANGSRHGLTIRDAQIKCTSCHGQRAMTDRHVYEGFATSIIANPANIKQYWSDMRNVNKTINDYCNTCHKEADTRGRVLRETHTSSKIIPYTIKYPPLITTTSANGFDRTGYTLGDIYPIQENFTGVTKSPLAAWTTDSPGTDDYEGGEDIYSSTNNAYVEYTFTGTYCAYVARFGPDSGTAQIFIDGQRYTDGTVSLPGDNPNEYSGVDLYSAVPAYRIVAATRSSLTMASHTIRVVVTSNKNALSSGYRVDVDAFKYAIPRVGHYLFAPQGPATTIISVTDPTHFTVANAGMAQLAVGNTITIDFADVPHPAQSMTIVSLAGNNVEVSSGLNASHTVDCTVSNTTKANCAGVCHDPLPDYIKNSQEAKTKITCVTCHHPHATPYLRVVRWPEDTKTGNVVTEGACLHCHNGSVKYNY